MQFHFASSSGPTVVAPARGRSNSVATLASAVQRTGYRSSSRQAWDRGRTVQAFLQLLPAGSRRRSSCRRGVGDGGRRRRCRVVVLAVIIVVAVLVVVAVVLDSAAVATDKTCESRIPSGRICAL